MNVAIHGIDFDFGKEPADTFTRQPATAPARSDRMIHISEIKHLAAGPGGIPQSAA
jgi:hypothetical protein